MNDVHLSAQTSRWLQAEADRLHGGDMGKAAAAIIEAARVAAQRPVDLPPPVARPDDPWADLQAEIRQRAKR